MTVHTAGPNCTSNARNRSMLRSSTRTRAPIPTATVAAVVPATPPPITTTVAGRTPGTPPSSTPAPP